MDADYADDIALIANTLAQARYLLQNLEQAASCIGLHVNADKTECTYLRGDISTLKGNPLKLVDKFTSSTKNDINIQLAKVWTAITRLSVIWKSGLTDKIKHSFFQAAVMSILLYGCTT